MLYNIIKKSSSLLITVLFLSISLNSSAQNLADYFKEVNTFLTKYSMDGMVKYSQVKKSDSRIEAIYNQIGSMNLDGASPAEKKAFYINAYNMVVIYQITKYYPLKSALDQSGFFDQVKHTIAGERMTLNKLEIVKLLSTYKDSRVHFALSCAAKGCPKLASFAFFPNKLDQQLKDRSELALNSNYFIRLNQKDKKVSISMIFKWYEKDFTTNGNTVLSSINKFRNNKIPSSYSIDYYKYDWSLNEY